jgi:hypothetical protein
VTAFQPRAIKRAHAAGAMIRPAKDNPVETGREKLPKGSCSMASLAKIRAASAALPGPLRITMAGLVAVALAMFAATQAKAQKGATSTELVFDAVEICVLIVSDLDDAEAELAATGWAIDYSQANGPFVWEFGASKIYDDGTDVYIFALLETYPTGLIGYCSFDAQVVPNTLDLEAVAAEYEVTGVVEYTDIGAYGAWEEFGDGGVYYVQASQDNADNYFFLQMTFVTGATDANGGGK